MSFLLKSCESFFCLFWFGSHIIVSGIQPLFEIGVIFCSSVVWLSLVAVYVEKRIIQDEHLNASRCGRTSLPVESLRSSDEYIRQ